MTAARFAALAAFSLLVTAPAVAQPAAITIDVTNFAFAPKPIHLAAGRPVTLNFVNRSSSRHDFTARNFFAASAISGAMPANGAIDLAPHQSRSITLTPRAGSYSAHCGHFMHKQFGMKTQIIVN
ncbi:MAG: cupredoxin domain-containing protein [Sphingomicrobium sp.]